MQVTDLACARAGVPVLEGLSFTVALGEALILRGPNGVGKTTLLRTMAGLQPALSGKISGIDDTAAFASHQDGVKAALSVAENLEFWAEVYGRDLPGRVYQDFDLESLRHRLAGTLSAGQKRRLGLARLGVIGRKVLLLDEPTVSLDQFSVKLFANWMRGHLQAGGIAVIATHMELGLVDAAELELSRFIAKDMGGGADGVFL